MPGVNATLDPAAARQDRMRTLLGLAVGRIAASIGLLLAVTAVNRAAS